MIQIHSLIPQDYTEYIRRTPEQSIGALPRAPGITEQAVWEILVFVMRLSWV